MTFEQAEIMLVDHPRFEGSSTRRKLWTDLERYLANFARLEELHREQLAGASLLLYLWIGGSYASSKINPKNVDITVILDDAACMTLRGQPGAGWLSKAFQRRHCVEEFAVNPLKIPYRRIVSPFRSNMLALEEQVYYKERGAWDDWWQRCRDPALADGSPSMDTVQAVRGYLEVTL